MQQIDADFAKAKAAELELEAVNLRENSEFLSAVAEGLDDEVKAAEMNLADGRQRHYELLPALGKAEAYQSLDDVRQALDVATAALADIEEKTAGISGLISENYSEIARVESILNQQKLVRSATAQIDEVKSKITDGRPCCSPSRVCWASSLATGRTESSQRSSHTTAAVNLVSRRSR